MIVATINNIKMILKQLVIVCVALILLVHNSSGQSGLISPKLDFGTSETTTLNYDSTLSTSVVKALVSLQHSIGPQKSIVSSKLDQSPFNFRTIATAVQNPKTDFTSLGVICVDGKCNTTESKASADKLSTDIMVQVVQTNVEGQKENKTIQGEDNDVPIVVGYAGTNVRPNGLESASRRIDGNQDVTITTGTDNNYNFYNLGKDNEVSKDHHDFQHQLPHFEPTFNNHYFGESPPPQFVWYRRRNGHGNNPHAFINRPYKPYNQWQLKYPTSIPQVHTPTGWTPTTTCTCSNPGLNWYPSFGPHQPTPAAPINNKMSPLN